MLTLSRLTDKKKIELKERVKARFSKERRAIYMIIHARIMMSLPCWDMAVYEGETWEIVLEEWRKLNA